MRISTKLLSALVVASAVTLSPVAPATADPAKGFEFTIADCDNGATYNAVFQGHGAWTVAHDTGSNAVFIPIYFGEHHAEIRDANGNLVDIVPFPGSTKGNTTTAHEDAVRCTEIITDSFEDPELGPLTFTLTGPVYGMVTPGGR